MQKFYKSATISQKSILTAYSFTSPHESAICPFCETVNTGDYESTNKGYLIPITVCKHFKAFVSGGALSVVAMFEGWNQE